MDDITRVLVAHASAHGSTAEVADRIAARLDDSGLDVDTRPAGPGIDVEAYDAVVLGSAVHDMAWLPSAIEFLARIPGTMPVWFFSVGGLAPDGPVTRRLVALELARVEQGFPTALRGHDHQLFAGVVRMSGRALWGRVFWRLLGGRAGDHRDWPAIDAWARRIGSEVRLVTEQERPPGARAWTGRPTRAERPPEARTSATAPDAHAPGSSSAPTA